MTTRDQLAQVLHPDLLDRIDAYINERVNSAVNALQPTNGHSRWVTLEDAAELAGCTTDAMRMRLSRHRYRSRRDGARVYVLRGDVDPDPELSDRSPGRELPLR
jgi:hypothetical protein